ncbi:MAG: hypothetical protein U0Y82_09160 [Thermoleophilia bacterium]
MHNAPFPPPDGWCVEIVDVAAGHVVDRRTFALAEDAREFAKRHVWANKGHRAEVFNREAGETVFTTTVVFPRELRG